MNRVSRMGLAVLAGALLGACNPKADNIPLEIAMHQPPKPLVGLTTQVAPDPALPEQPILLAQQRWVPTATEYALPDRMVRPAGASAGHTLHALAWDQPPFDRLLLRLPSGLWREFAEVW